MVDWLNIPEGPYSPMYEVLEFKDNEEPVDIYRLRYIRRPEELHPRAPSANKKNIDEIISYFGPKASMLSLGSGHSYFCNCVVERFPEMDITALDMVYEASAGLSPKVKFLNINILEEDILGMYDYVYSAHTLEHFTRDELFDIVVPKVMKIVRKAFVVLVPYADNWAGEPNHKCRFYENDEFAALASKYKMVTSQEIAYWIDAIEEIKK